MLVSRAAKSLLVLALTAVVPDAVAAGHTGAVFDYAWHRKAATLQTLAERFAPPPGFTRDPVAAGSFAAFLRNLPLRAPDTPVLLYTGSPKYRQDVHAAIVDIDVGDRDLQQCADAVMRLRAEWLWSIGAKDRIAFDYTGGGRVAFARFARGERPSEDGKRWRRRGSSDQSYAGFRRYMTNVFVYAGTYSLAQELKPVASDTPEIGDVIIKGGFPGHAVLVADRIDNHSTGESRFLLLQSYMPAQDIHVLKNPAAGSSPWYATPILWPLVTPEWTFAAGSLKRWP